MRSKYEVKFQMENHKKKLSGASQKCHFSLSLSYHLTCNIGIEFWQYLLIGGELGSETYIDALLVSSALSPPIFTLIGNDDFYTNLVWKSWCFVLLRFRRCLGEIESGGKSFTWDNFLILFFACAVLCQGQCFQFSSPKSQKRWR